MKNLKPKKQLKKRRKKGFGRKIIFKAKTIKKVKKE